ncbi:MAG: hypothetical protein A3I44_00985 [Candidatus Sungbacteria bacterium RIFCSPLOWO2_02_FULL_51_17]|nr:MAG: hypothetical protein A2676_03315 [Candidatus Sungbacteria bacterium RIFCSPHIGHO2_01_FULL_51_22]OHA07441.1 MAG: hypothetical protein A3B29_02135 [Candidatus Sungbacteria bacterium RIFCSPLOWO2_01_FULL_51_34]OHA10954.1 MAG: hypothetical protein A3I44_00985 [Candidatus Sungbacteria bacterium RIFCSPLOWO2_02_FULL_51_17]
MAQVPFLDVCMSIKNNILPRVVAKPVAFFTILMFAVLPVAPAVPVFLHSAYAAAPFILFSDGFDQNGSSLTTNTWDNVSGESSGSRDDTEDGFTVGASGKGILLEGAGNSGDNEHASDPDETAERTIATRGYSDLVVSYSRALGSVEADDSFVAEYALDGDSFTELESLNANQAHGVVSFAISNPERKTKLTLRFMMNGTDNSDKVGIDTVTVMGEGDPLYYDGFESNNFTAGSWTTEETPNIDDGASNSWTRNDATASDANGHSARIDGSTGANPDDAMYTTVDTAGYEDIMLRFARKVDNMESGEALRVLVSTVVGTPVWSEVYAVENVDWASVSLTLPSDAENNPNTKIRFEVNSNSSNDDSWVDDVVVWGTEIKVPSSIAGAKFNDYNGNGGWDDGEPGISGWTIKLYDAGGGLSGTRATDAGGRYSFEGLESGTYTVCEVRQDGWRQTFPESGASCPEGTGSAVGYSVTVSGSDAGDKNFGNALLGHVVVQKVTDPADSEETFEFQFGDEDMFRLGDGDKETLDVVAGTYEIMEDVPPGWALTDSSCVYDGESVGEETSNGERVTVEAGDTVVCTFTNTQNGSITIEKEILSEDDADQATLFGFAMEGMNFQLPKDDGEGGYEYEQEFADRAPGEYRVAEITGDPDFDLLRISCSDENSAGDLEAGEAIIRLEAGEDVSCTFTNVKRGSVHIEKEADPSEGLFTFNLAGPTEASGTITGSGMLDFADLVTGLLGGEYSLAEILPDGWAGTQSSYCGEGDTTSDGAVNFTLEPGQEVTCYFNNTRYGKVAGKKFNDKNMNGERDTGEGGVKNWPMDLWFDHPEDGWTRVSSVDTGRGGNYSFEDLAPGMYRVCEGTKDLWTQTYPQFENPAEATHECENGTVGYEFEMSAGEIQSADFGNYKKGAITGKKFEDLDGDAEKDENEEWLSGWRIYLDMDGSNTLTEGDISTETNGSGKYTFTELDPGTYTIREDMPEEGGWMQTYPGGEEDEWEVVIESGKTLKKKHFGNARASTISGYKWNDADGDGEWDDGEVGVEGWQMALGKVGTPENGSDAIPIEIIALELTGEGGAYQFHTTALGEYVVFEERKDGWSVTYPALVADSFFDITYRIDGGEEPALILDSFFDVFVEFNGQQVMSDQGERALRFGNFPHTTIAGHKWNDLDGDGVWGDGEEGIDGWQMALGRRGEPQNPEEGPAHVPIEIVALSLTGADGGFTLPVTAPGQYGVFEASRDGWSVMHPAPVSDSFFDITYHADLPERPVLVSDSFFDVFVEIGGQQILGTDGEALIPFNFGNHQTEMISEALPLAPPPPAPNVDNGMPGFGGGSGNSGGNSGGGSVLGASTTGGEEGQAPGVEHGICPTGEYITQYMRIGRTNDPVEVKKLQALLNGLLGTHLPLTGFFGVLTNNAVKDFQRTYWEETLRPWGIPRTDPTGYVYKLTKRALNMLKCKVTIPLPELN